MGKETEQLLREIKSEKKESKIKKILSNGTTKGKRL